MAKNKNPILRAIKAIFQALGVKTIRSQLLILNTVLLLIGLTAIGSIYLSVHSGAATINMAGRQRMLSQRVAKEALLVAQGVGQRNSVGKTIEIFEGSHNKLLQGDPILGINRATDKAVRSKLEQVKRLWNSYSQHLTDYVNDGDEKHLAVIMAESSEILYEMNQTVKMMETLSAASTINQAWNAVIMILLMLISSFLLYLFVNARLMTPLIQLNSAFSQGAKGDFSNALPDNEGEDEMSHTFRAYNTMTESFSEMVGAVIKSSASVGTVSYRLSSAAQMSSSGMSQQYLEIEQISTAMNEMSATVQEVTRSIHHAAEQTSQANQEASASRLVMSSASQSIGELNKQVESVSEVITHLDADSQEIGKVLDVIRDITEQTNLLALNAAIEAARAGEQGRGFAVVAGEVRALAARTSESTQEIRTMIEQLQRQAHAAVTAIEISKERAVASVTQVTEADSSLSRISESMSNINEMNIQIATAAEEQSQVAEDMNRRIVEIAGLAEKTQSYTEMNLTAAGKIAESVDDLRDKSSRFQTKDVGLELESAKAAHLAWLGKLRVYLDGKSDLTKEQAVSHRHCVLGKWYYTEGLQKFGHLPEMKEIEHPHEELHNLIKRIIELKDAGKQEEAEVLFEKIEPLSERIVSLLDAIGIKVSHGNNKPSQPAGL